MLYQLSYASTSKPAEVITQALKLQGALNPPHVHYHSAIGFVRAPQLYTSRMQICTEKLTSSLRRKRLAKQAPDLDQASATHAVVTTVRRLIPRQRCSRMMIVTAYTLTMIAGITTNR